jgi:hypothetical protein
MALGEIVADAHTGPSDRILEKRTFSIRLILSTVVVDGKLITGQNRQSASEYAIAFNHVLASESPVLGAAIG